MRSIGIVGSGASARALACHLSSRDFDVRLLVRPGRSLEFIPRAGGELRATGVLNGAFPIAGWSDDAASFAAQCPTIVLATLATAYREVTSRLAAHLHAGHRLVCFSSKLGGVLEVEAVLAAHSVLGVEAVETDALFASRVDDGDGVWIRGAKRWTLFSAASRSKTERYSGWFRSLFPGLDAADHVVQRGLTDFGALAHAPTMIANMSHIDRSVPFLFYREGFGARSIALLEAVEQEFGAVARAYDTTLVPMRVLLDRYYGCDSSSLLAAMKTVPNYAHSAAPATLDHRYLAEDVACTLVPLRQLARIADVPTPTLDAIVHFASLVLNRNLESSGRSIAEWGFAGLTQREIVARLLA